VLQQEGAGCLVIGTEDSRLLILDPTATRVSISVTLGAPAAFLAIAGTLNAGYRVTAAARDGKLYTIKAGALSSSVIQLDAQAVGVVSGRSTNRFLETHPWKYSCC
jgi:hypothetical protein